MAEAITAEREKRGKILIVAGGTGGHIFPAVAFGRWLLTRNKGASVSYLSGNRPLELEIYASQGIEPYRLSLSGSPLGSSSVFRNLGRWLELARAFFRAGRFLRDEEPDLCFLFGGYVSLLPLLWCRLLKIPAIAHEQNACAGKATRLASRLGVLVAAGWPQCRGLKGPFVPVGVPVRPLDKISRRKAACILGVDAGDEDLVVGVIGGSLGSAPLSDLAEKVSEERFGSGKNENPLFIVLGDAPDTSRRTRVRFVGRQWDMTAFFSLCDAAVCRAGASTLAELAAYEIPTLAIPWEKAADGHQEANARCFATSTGNLVWFERKRREKGEENKEEQKDLEKAFRELLKRAGSARRSNGRRDARDREQNREREFASEASLALWRLGEEKLRLL
jgi:UDP-N-acetylglucosamine--N-acetylmuramyl-(pentapeptide) pyrophosphoryl-undecaprenol N-acetylglucosamine transferase